jgi:hypothetical protein
MRKANEMKEAQARGANGRFLPTTSPQEARIATLEAQVVQLQTSNAWNAAESVRLAEEKRLAEQGRDAALSLMEECRSVMAPYMADGGKHQPLRQLCAASAIAMSRTKALGKERDALEMELDATIAHLDELSQENTRLASQLMPEELPLLPLWIRIAFSCVVFFLIAYLAHQAGFNAAMEAVR